MSFVAVRPIQHNIGCRHMLNTHHFRVDWMLAGMQWISPYAFMPGMHQVTMLEVETANILMCLADIADDHTDVANRNFGHRHLFNKYKPGIKIPRTGQQYLLLQTTSSTHIHEFLSILEIIMPINEQASNR